MCDKRMDNDEKTPLQAGLYLARAKDGGWFHIIVRIWGEAPYLQYKAWDMLANKIAKGSTPSYHFGEKLADNSALEG